MTRRADAARSSSLRDRASAKCLHRSGRHRIRAFKWENGSSGHSALTLSLAVGLPSLSSRIKDIPYKRKKCATEGCSSQLRL